MEFNIKMPQEIRLTKKHIFALIAIALLIFGYEKMGSETLTLHAYYPSPVGIYTRLVSLNKAAFAREKGDVTIGANNAATRPDGRLGIGTSLPQAKLDVRGNTDIDGLFRARGTSSFDGNINAGGNISSGGYVKLGTPATCDASAVGAIRYLASTGIQYCENNTWNTPSGTAAPPTSSPTSPPTPVAVGGCTYTGYVAAQYTGCTIWGYGTCINIDGYGFAYACGCAQGTMQCDFWVCTCMQ